MLTRPGSLPGPAWIRRISERIAGPSSPTPPDRRLHWFWIVFAAMMIWLALVQPLPGPINPPQGYESPVRIGGLPLLAVGAHPRGIIAYGSFPVGVIAIGGLSVGLIAIGGVAFGGVALSGVSVAILAIGGGAVGWWAFGGGAVGYYAFGGLAVGGYAYAGNGVAYGYHEASGRQKERLFGQSSAAAG